MSRPTVLPVESSGKQDFCRLARGRFPSGFIVSDYCSFLPINYPASGKRRVLVPSVHLRQGENSYDGNKYNLFLQYFLISSSKTTLFV
jgi:hypothetical protein